MEIYTGKIFAGKIFTGMYISIVRIRNKIAITQISIIALNFIYALFSDFTLFL